MDARGSTLVKVEYNGGVLLGTDGCLYLEKTPENVTKHKKTDIVPTELYYDELEKKLKAHYTLSANQEADILHGKKRRESLVKTRDDFDKIISINTYPYEIIGASIGCADLSYQFYERILEKTTTWTMAECVSECKKLQNEPENVRLKLSGRFVFASHANDGKLHTILVTKDGDDPIHKPYFAIGAGESLAMMVLTSRHISVETTTKEEAIAMTRDALEAASLMRLSGGLPRIICLDQYNFSLDEDQEPFWKIPQKS